MKHFGFLNLIRQQGLLYHINVFDKAVTNGQNPYSGNHLRPSTIESYLRATALLRQFLMQKPEFKIGLKSIGKSFYLSYRQYLLEQGFSTNYIGKQITVLRLILQSEEVQPYLVQPLETKCWKGLHEDVYNIALSEDELARLEVLSLHQGGLECRVRDAFLLLAWTGCRFSDLHQLQRNAICCYQNTKLLYLQQTKTGNDVFIPIHPTVDKILSAYPEGIPRMSVQVFNRKIKQLCRLAGITSPETYTLTRGGVRQSYTVPRYQMVSSHTARRSFATNMFNRGVPSYTIMQITGHRSERVFKKYIKMSALEHACKLSHMWLT